MKNTGAILIQTIAFIAILAIISIAMVSMLREDIKLTHKHNIKQQIFTNNFNALLQGEIQLNTFKRLPNISTKCNVSTCINDFNTQHNWHDINFWKQHAINLTDDKQPSYFYIQLLSRLIDLNTLVTTDYYQITAIGFDAHSQIKVITQRVVSKKYDEHGNTIKLQTQRHSWHIVY